MLTVGAGVGGVAPSRGLLGSGEHLHMLSVPRILNDEGYGRLMPSFY